jgi:hypothetical protein
VNRQHCVNGLALNDTTGMNLITFRLLFTLGLTVTFRANFQLFQCVEVVIDFKKPTGENIHFFTFLRYFASESYYFILLF